MAVLPVFTAWTLNLALAYDVALAGMYLFLRRQAHRLHRRHLRCRHLRVRRVHDRPDRPHRPDRRGGLAAVDADGRPRPDRTPGPRSADRGASGAGRRQPPVWVAPAGRLPRAHPPEPGRPRPSSTAGCWSASTRSGGWSTMGYLRRGAGDGPCSRRWPPSWPGWPVGWPSERPSGSPASPSSPSRNGPTATYGFFTSGSLTIRLLTLIASPFVLGTNQGVPGGLRRALQLPRGDQLRGDPGPHRRVLAVPQAVAEPARGPPLVDLVRDPRRRPAVRPRWPDPLRPRHVPHPRRRAASGCSTATCSWSTSPGRAAGLVGPPPARRPGRRRPDDGRAEPVRRSVAGGRRAEVVVTCRPLRRHRRAVPSCSGRRARTSSGCWTSSSP